MVKVFILVLWATGVGADVGPEPYSTMRECQEQGPTFVNANNGYESFNCVELEIGNPE